MTNLRLNKLVLTNFRCFAHCEIELHPRLTVLVAENSHGKTTLLDAISLALSSYVTFIQKAEKPKRIQRTDIRLVKSETGEMKTCLPSSFVADGVVVGQSVRWESSLKKEKSRPTTIGLKQLQNTVQKIDSNGILPLVAFYGTGRLWGEHRLTEGRRTSVTDMKERLGGYTDCLISSSSFKDVSEWYKCRFIETKSPVYQESLAANLALLTTVREAARIVLEPTGWSILDWDELNGLVAEHAQNGRFPLSSLSDGIRNMLALVIDVARRCASLNPQLREEAAQKTPGVLLIDEVDMHLHPSWQQLVMELLSKAFPTLQIIATTHSPHVLSTVDKNSIRVIRVVDGQAIITTPSLQTRGVESADVLASVMGIDPVPQLMEAKQLSEYRAIIENGQAESEQASALRTVLTEHFGEKHPVMLDCDRLIRFQTFRLKNGASKR